MLIDWFTVAAQVTNFLVLILLLKHFLYGRVIAAMDQREKSITAAREEAAKRKSEAEQERASYEQRKASLEKEGDRIVALARQEADEQRKQLLSNARDEVNKLKKEWQDSVRREQDIFLQHLREGITRELERILKQALKDLANEKLEEKIAETFLSRISGIDENTIGDIRKAVLGTGRNIIVQSAYTLPLELQTRITSALRARIDPSLVTEYEVSPVLISGIQVLAPGYRIGWNIESYMSELKNNLTETIKRAAP